MMRVSIHRTVSVVTMVALLQPVSWLIATSHADAEQKTEQKSESKTQQKIGEKIGGAIGSNGGDYDMFPKVEADWEGYKTESGYSGFDSLAHYTSDLILEIYAAASPSAVEYWDHEELQTCMGDIGTLVHVLIRNGEVVEIVIDKENSHRSPVINKWALQLIQRAVKNTKLPPEKDYEADVRCMIFHPKGYSIRTDTGKHLHTKPANGTGIVTSKVLRVRTNPNIK